MPKLKNHRGTKKRVKLSAGGKLLRAHGASNHFLAKKRSTRKRAYTKIAGVAPSDAKNVKRSMSA